MVFYGGGENSVEPEPEIIIEEDDDNTDNSNTNVNPDDNLVERTCGNCSSGFYCDEDIQECVKNDKECKWSSNCNDDEYCHKNAKVCMLKHKQCSSAWDCGVNKACDYYSDYSDRKKCVYRDFGGVKPELISEEL